MKRRLVYFVGLALLCLLLVGFALRSPQAASEETVASGGGYVLSQSASQVEQATLSGGRYRLSGDTGRLTEDVASGGKYRLVEESAPRGGEDGCCCNYLPCVSK